MTFGSLVSAKRLLWLLLVMGIAFCIPSWLTGWQVLPTLSKLPLASLLALTAAMVATWLLQTARYILLLKPYFKRAISFRPAILFYLAMQFSSRVTPLGAGSPVIEYMLVRRYGIRLSRVGAVWIATFMLDACSILFWCLAAAIFSPTLSTSSLYALIGVMLILLILILPALFLLKRRRLFASMLLYIVKMAGLNTRWRQRLIRFLLRVSHGMEDFLREAPRKKAGLIALSLTLWALLLSLLWLSVLAAGGQSEWLATMAIQIIASTAGHVSLLPAGAVGAEAVAALLLTPAQGAVTSGAAILLWRCTVFYVPIAAGLVSFALIQHHLAGPRTASTEAGLHK